MMGQKQFAPRLFHALSLQAMVPPDHLLRRLEAVVDLAFVRELCAGYYSRTGQPSIDPVVLFKMMLLGYLYGITSERRLAEECALHLAFRWYLGYDLDEPTPDHSVLSKARARYGQTVFEAFFQRVLKAVHGSRPSTGREDFCGFNPGGSERFAEIVGLSRSAFPTLPLPPGTSGAGI